MKPVEGKLMKHIGILITESPDRWVMDDVEDEINTVMSSHFSNWDYTITIQDVTE